MKTVERTTEQVIAKLKSMPFSSKMELYKHVTDVRNFPASDYILLHDKYGFDIVNGLWSEWYGIKESAIPSTLELNYTTKDKSIHFRVIFIQKQLLKMYYVGKTYPKHTQCLIFYNGLLKSFGTVVKHYTDEDNQNEAFLLSARKACKDVTPFVKSEVLRIVNEHINKSK